MKQCLPLAMAMTCALTLTACNVKIDGVTPSGEQANKNRQPTITSFVANPTNTSTAGQVITFGVDVVDPDNDILKYTWTASDGTLSTNAGRIVSWTPPMATGTYVVQVSISDQKGGTAEGSQNITVKDDGTATVGK